MTENLSVEVTLTRAVWVAPAEQVQGNEAMQGDVPYTWALCGASDHVIHLRLRSNQCYLHVS